MTSRQGNSSKRSCLFLLLLVFVVLPILVLSLGLLLWFGRESSGNSRLKARIATLSKQGYPVDDATAEAFYKDRTDPTNTDAWMEVLATVNGDEFGTSTNGVPILGLTDEPPHGPNTDWPDEQIARDFLGKWTSLGLSTLRLSMDAQPVRFPIVFDSFNSIDMKRLQGMRNIGRLLNLQGYVASRDGNSAGVRDAVGGLLGLSRVVAGEPMLVSHLVSIAIDGTAIGVLKDAIQFDVLNEEDLQFLLPRVLALSTIGKDWETAFAGERALALPLFGDRKKAKAAGTILVISNSRDAILYIDFIDELLEEPSDDLSAFEVRLKAVQNSLMQKVSANWLARIDSMMTSQTTPVVTSCGSAFIRRALQHRLAALAIGLRLYEKRHGGLPSELMELTHLPFNLEQVSPSKNQSFGYRRAATTAKLWGGNVNDAFAIPPEPPFLDQDSLGNDPNGIGFWTWELSRK